MSNGSAAMTLAPASGDNFTSASARSAARAPAVAASKSAGSPSRRYSSSGVSAGGFRLVFGAIMSSRVEGRFSGGAASPPAR